MGDPLRLRQVFVNIMSNAVKYTPAGGRIYIDVWQEDGLKLGYGSFISVVRIRESACQRNS